MLAAVKFARWYELDEDDLVLTVLTDSMDMYRSRLREMSKSYGELSEREAIGIFYQYLLGATTDNMAELTYPERKRIHNLKYFTWVEQQGKTYEEIQSQWYERNYWEEVQSSADGLDQLIVEFNQRPGLLV